MITLKAALFKLFNVTLSVYSLRFYIFSQFCSLFAYASRSRSDVCKIYQRDRVAFSTHSRNALFFIKDQVPKKIHFPSKKIHHSISTILRMSRERFFVFFDSFTSMCFFYGTISGQVSVVFLYLYFPLSDSNKHTIFLILFRPKKFTNTRTPTT